MARAARTFAAVDVNYLEDDRVLAAGAAWRLHFAAILTAKRGTTDGFVTKRQLRRNAPETVADDFDEFYRTCIAVGLFIETGTSEGVRIRSWERWNDTQEVIEKKSRDAVFANHVKWHTGRRGKPSLKCPHCEIVAPSGMDSMPDPTRIEDGSWVESKRREDVDTDVDVENPSGERSLSTTEAELQRRRNEWVSDHPNDSVPLLGEFRRGQRFGPVTA